MNQMDGINFLQGHYEGSDLTGALIREEYSEAFRAVILEFATTGEFNDLTEAASDEELGQNEIGVQDSESYLNPFINLPHTRSKRKGFILIGHPGIGEYTPSLSPKIQTFLITFAGKSLWLTVLLILRVHAGLPTLYIDLSHNMYTSLMTRASSNLNVQHTEPDWDEITSKRHTTLSTETWALIDSSSNQGHISVPPAYRTNYFVVQAAYPRCEEG